ncbi:phytanoyl-CoA dioxygenase [Caballeronia pedi]|uniref:Phytanoyl-CoA dioxygenase n=1 Tax=Caballeronia pedi TaxID=1777141 RepID=A0A157ZK06_9BURK|nr:phytanoyl-CoA dioxygenase family protein [Caballeronia pedi]SAK45831.1 phytanoyl-CoA dioxygenase [Caballeronia pedi]
MTTISPSHCESFWKDGFLRLKNVATHADIGTLRNAGDRLMREKAGFAEGLLFDFYPEANGLDKPRLAQLHQPSHFERDLLDMELARRVQRIAMQLLGPKARFVSDSFFHKPAHTDAVTPWHQDEAFTDPRIEHREVNFWFPLQPVSLANGCMQFIPGSHLGPVLPHEPIGGDPTAHGLECSSGFDADEAVICPLEPGDCTIHAGRTLHFAGPNHSDAPRYAYSLVFGLPRRASREARSFPWHDDRHLSRDARVRESRRARGRFWPYLYRKVREFDYTNPYEWRLGAHRLARFFKR